MLEIDGSPAAWGTGPTATVGGGYELVVQVKDANGKVVPEKKLKLGGGPNRKVPKWAVDAPKNLAPVLDDENVPLFGGTVRFEF